MNMLFNFVHMPDHIRDMSFHLMNRYFYSNFTVYKLALGKKVNNLPPPHDIKPIFLAPAGGGCHNPSV